MVGVIARLNQIIRCKESDFTEAKVVEQQYEARKTLLEEISVIQREIRSAQSHFDFQTDFELIEADIFHINELEARYGFLIKKAKREKIAI